MFQQSLALKHYYFISVTKVIFSILITPNILFMEINTFFAIIIIIMKTFTAFVSTLKQNLGLLGSQASAFQSHSPGCEWCCLGLWVVLYGREPDGPGIASHPFELCPLELRCSPRSQRRGKAALGGPRDGPSIPCPSWYRRRHRPQGQGIPPKAPKFWAFQPRLNSCFTFSRAQQWVLPGGFWTWPGLQL